MNIVLLFLFACSDGGKLDDTGPGSATCDYTHEECAPGVSGCSGESANMLPGSDCISCHTGSGEAPKWQAAGTLFTDLDGTLAVADATVRVTDSTGTTVEMTTSSKGNFYTSKSLVPPLSAEVETDAGIVAMSQTVETGACNSCHQCDGTPGGKMYAP